MLLAEVQYQKNGAFIRTLIFLHDKHGAIIGVGVKNAGEARFTNYYYAKNLQGDVVAMYFITTEPPKLIATYEYDEWGKVKTVRDATGAILTSPAHLANRNPFRYRGYHYDIETGFYYLQSRYYDPAISRFINADSYASTGHGFIGTNMFAYCNNNSINCVDSNGFLLERLIGGAVGALAGGCINAFTTWVTGGTTEEIIDAALWGATYGGITGAFPEATLGVNIFSGVKTAWDCWSYGMPFWGSLSCGLLDFGASFVIGNTGDKVVDKFIDYTFGIGVSLSVCAVTTGAQKEVEAIKGNKRRTVSRSEAPGGYTAVPTLGPREGEGGGAGIRLRYYW
jgi:RHS repeat-associated protein